MFTANRSTTSKTRLPLGWRLVRLTSVLGILGGIAAGAAFVYGEDRAIQVDYPLTRLTDRVYVIHGPNEAPTKANQGFRNNPVIVLTSAGTVVIDPGSSVYIGKMVLKKALGLSNKPVVAVFNPTRLPPNIYLIAIYSRLGQIEEASWQRQNVELIAPGLDLEHWVKELPFKDQKLQQSVVNDLRRVGLKAESGS